MIIGTCVCTNGGFTLFDEYIIYQRPDGLASVQSDEGHLWYIGYQGDGYYGCFDCYGKEVSFLVE